MIGMKRLLLLLLSIPLFAQTTRPVLLSWTASTTATVTGYNVFRATSSAGPFTQLNTVSITGTSYTDAGTIGQTYTYYVTAQGPLCTPATPVATPCGQSAPSTAVSTTVPAQPGVTISVTIAIQ